MMDEYQRISDAFDSILSYTRCHYSNGYECCQSLVLVARIQTGDDMQSEKGEREPGISYRGGDMAHWLPRRSTCPE